MPIRSSKPTPETLRLRRRARRVERIGCDLYMMLCAANAPTRFLDAAAALANGWPLGTKTLKPLTKPEVSSLGKEFGSRG